MSRRYRSNVEKFFAGFIIFLVVALLITGVVALVNSFQPRDGYSDVNLSYTVGEIVIDSTGKGVASSACKTALYSNEAVRCTGFKIVADFKYRCDYEIHYYTEDNVYIGYVSKSDISYNVDVGEMPVLKSYIGDVESQAYKEAEVVNGDDGKEQVAAYIRVVLRAIDADDDVFTGGFLGLNGMATRAAFDRSFDLRATTKLPRTETSDSVASPSNPA